MTLLYSKETLHANNVPPQIAALVEVGIQQTLVKLNKTADNGQYSCNLAGGQVLQS